MSRTYEVTVLSPTGKKQTFKFPSVTTILSHVGSSHGLTDWYYKQGVQGVATLLRRYGENLPADLPSLHSLLSQEGLSPYSIRDAAGKHGDDLHKALEKIAKGRKLPASFEKDFPQLMDWYQEVGMFPKEQVEASEEMVISFKYRYGGTLDLLFWDWDGKLTLLDLKTSSKVRWQHWVQLEAYRLAWEEQGGDAVEKLAILHIPREGGEKWHYATELPGRRTGIWLAALEVYHNGKE